MRDKMDIDIQTNRGSSLTIIGAISEARGLVHSNIIEGTTTAQSFQVFIQQIKGKGSVLVSSFGAIHKVALAPGQTMVVDNSHLVAWTDTVQYEIQKASSGWFSSVTSGEGLVCHVKGPGDVYFQTRNPGSFGQWIRRFIPSQG